MVFYHFAQNVTISGITDILVSRTGYTGEDGFELYLAADKVAELWDKLLSWKRRWLKALWSRRT